MVDSNLLRKFVAPEYIFGLGARFLAGRYARNLGARKVMVVSDPGVVVSGWTQQVIDSLAQESLETILFTHVSPNPVAEEVMEGAELYKSSGCNALVAVGGGSPIDCAKGIGIVSVNKGNILAFEGIDKVHAAIPLLICIPTTGGTSADVSQFAIIRDIARKTKIAIVSKAVVPDLSLIDPETLSSMDPYLTACTGMDALTHAIEAFVSSAHSPMTDLHALEAIRLLSTNLLPAIEKPHDLELRSQVMLGSLQAGLAFSNAILGATHAMAHSLGGYLDLAHGECNAILLDHVMAFNLRTVPERFERIAQAMGMNLQGLSFAQKRMALMKKIRQMKDQTGINRNLANLGVSRSDLSSLSETALRDPCMITNPRQPSKRDIEVIYEEAL